MKKFRIQLVTLLRLPILQSSATALVGMMVQLLLMLQKEHDIDTPFSVMQVGGRGGADPYTEWLRHRKRTTTIGVEPESSGLKKLQEKKAFDIIVPHAFSNTRGLAKLYITKAKGWCSLLKPDEQAIRHIVTERCWNVRPFDVISTEEITVTTFDTIKSNIPAVDYLQIDVQGAELSVLQGAEKSLDNIGMIELEVRFYPLYENEPLFSDVHAYLEKKGFVLVQMTRQGEREFGEIFVEANACYRNERFTKEKPSLMKTLQRYAHAKHAWYAHPLLRLYCDIKNSDQLRSSVVST